MKHAVVAFAIAAAASGSFAQAVQSSSNIPVTSGTGVVVTPGVVATGTVVSTSVPTVTTLPAPRYAGAVMAQASTSESVSGNTKTVTTRYWANVPAGAERDDRFQRWQRLK
jgi:ABC-type multidrug transport system permease subunit